jgi:acyl carrier protein
VTDASTSNSTVTCGSILLSIREELAAIGFDAADSFEPSSQWDEIDIDSIEVVELVAALEEEFGVDMTNEDYNELKTPDMLVRRVSQLVAHGTTERAS